MAQLILTEIPAEELRRMIENATAKAIKENITQKSDDNEILSSITEISQYLKCSRTTAQSLKNRFPRIFHLVGLRKFVVRKSDLLEAISNK